MKAFYIITTEFYNVVIHYLFRYRHLWVPTGGVTVVDKDIKHLYWLTTTLVCFKPLTVYILLKNAK